MALFWLAYTRHNDDYDDCCRHKIILETGSWHYGWLKRVRGAVCWWNCRLGWLPMGFVKPGKKREAKGKGRKRIWKKGHISLYGSFVPNKKGDNVRRKWHQKGARLFSKSQFQCRQKVKKEEEEVSKEKPHTRHSLHFLLSPPILSHTTKNLEFAMKVKNGVR